MTPSRAARMADAPDHHARIAAVDREVWKRNGRRDRSGEIRFTCPEPDRHHRGDARPSARWNAAKQVWRCDVCNDGGGWMDLERRLGLSAELWHATAPERRTPGEIIVARYDYVDRQGVLLYQVVRLAPKAFRVRRPDGHGGWLWNLRDTPRVLYRLSEVLAAASEVPIYIVEGEKDADALAALGLVATTNSGGAGKWRDEYNEALRGHPVVILPDNDGVGREHAATVARSLAGTADSVRKVTLPGLPEKGDVSDWIAAGGTRERLEAITVGTPPVAAEPASAVATHGGPWGRAVTVAAFLAETDLEVDWIVEHFAAPGTITGIASPRGLCKTHVVHALAVAVARGMSFCGRPVRQGRVLIVDRDNPPPDARRRLREWCGEHPPEALKILTRNDAPALTDPKAWAAFPIEQYDLVILDALGSATEGIDDKDGGDFGKALKLLLDVCRRGPAVIVLMNVPKDGANYRGPGVIADRLDILYEARDFTDVTPTASDEVWWSSLPEAGEAAWKERAQRRVRRDDYRLVMVPTKYRIGEEPDPIAFEVRLTPGEWKVEDVTDDLLRAHDEARGLSGAEAVRARQDALKALAGLVAQRHAEGKPLRKDEASQELANFWPQSTRAERRTMVESGGDGRWTIRTLRSTRGKPQVLAPPDSAAEIDPLGNPCGTAAPEVLIFAETTAQGRQESSPRKPLIDASSSEAGFSPPDADDENEVQTWTD